MKKIPNATPKKEEAKHYSIDVRPNGTYRIRSVFYQDGNQIRRATTYYPKPVLTLAGNRAAAEKVARDFVNQVKAELAAAKKGKDITFGEYFAEKYEEKARVYFADTTFRFYMNTIRRLFLDEYKDIPLKDITKSMVQETIRVLGEKENENSDPEDDECIKGQTVKRYMTAFRSVINFAIDDRIIDTDPFVGGFRYPKFDVSNVVCLNEVDFREIISDLYCKISDPALKLDRNDIIVAIGLFSGARRGEAVALRWKNIINLSERTLDNVHIDISYSASKTSGEPQKIGSTKTYSSVRTFTIPHFLAEVLWNWKKTLIENNGYVSEDDFIISDGHGGMVSVYSPTKWFKDYLMEHELKDVKLHSLRHTFASMMLETGMDPYDLQNLMGHKKFSTTEIYLKSFKVNRSNLIKTFNKYAAALLSSKEEKNED